MRRNMVVVEVDPVLIAEVLANAMALVVGDARYNGVYPSNNPYHHGVEPRTNENVRGCHSFDEWLGSSRTDLS